MADIVKVHGHWPERADTENWRASFSVRLESPPVSQVNQKLLQTRPSPTNGELRKSRNVGGGRFFVLATALPVLTALGEDAGKEGFAGFKRRVVVGRVP